MQADTCVEMAKPAGERLCGTVNATDDIITTNGTTSNEFNEIALLPLAGPRRFTRPCYARRVLLPGLASHYDGFPQSAAKRIRFVIE